MGDFAGRNEYGFPFDVDLKFSGFVVAVKVERMVLTKTLDEERYFIGFRVGVGHVESARS